MAPIIVHLGTDTAPLRRDIDQAHVLAHTHTIADTPLDRHSSRRRSSHHHHRRRRSSAGNIRHKSHGRAHHKHGQ